jgi:predicted DsbA family dithiol-disulfide isomerase
MRTSIRVWADYVCPWCYIGLAELERVRNEFDVSIERLPFELRPDAPESGWQLPDHIRAKLDSPANPVRVRAKQLGLALHERVHVPSSRRAHQCAEFARAEGKIDAFHAAVLKSYWTDGEDIHDWTVLEKLANGVGLDGAAMREGVDAGTWRAAFETRVAEAHAIGVDAVPTFVIADRFVVEGAQPAQVFREALVRATT